MGEESLEMACTHEPPLAGLEDHIVVLWPEGEHFATLDRLIEMSGTRLVVVAPGSTEWSDTCASRLALSDVHTIDADPSDGTALLRASVATARSVLLQCGSTTDATVERGSVLTGTDSVTLRILLAVRAAAPHTPVCTLVMHAKDAYMFGVAGASIVIAAEVTAAQLLAQGLLQNGATHVHTSMATASADSCEAYVVPLPESLNGATFGEGLHRFRGQGVTLVGVRSAGRMLVNPNPGLGLSECSDLVVIAADMASATRIMGAE